MEFHWSEISADLCSVTVLSTVDAFAGLMSASMGLHTKRPGYPRGAKESSETTVCCCWNSFARLAESGSERGVGEQVRVIS